MKNIFYLSIIIFFTSCTQQTEYNEPKSSLLDDMKVQVTENENREISFCNKKSAYFYTQSHHNNHEEFTFFTGMNIAQKRIFHGYQLLEGDQKIDIKNSNVDVFPHKMIRAYSNGIQETFWMHDFVNLLEVDVQNANTSIGLELKGDITLLESNTNQIAYYTSMEGEKVIAVMDKNKSNLDVKGKMILSKDNDGFFIAVGNSKTEATKLLTDAVQHGEQWKKNRISRMEKLLTENAFLQSSNKDFNNAMNWMVITMDQLVSEQQGHGIYAGLPWFNEYWGRDEFISMPGAVLVTGQFDWAKNILKSFSEYQQTDPNSKFFGRVPNIVNPSGIDYHTTDGTPRFIGELYDYVRYSGDKSLINELYPVVKRSIDGAIENWTDKKGYLLHDDHETWMDAKRNYDKLSYSPRGARANDIQALWYKQLSSGIYFAKVIGDQESEDKWKKIAENVHKHFNQDFIDNKHNYIADRLDQQNQADYKIRPNQLFSYDLVNDEALKLNATKVCWEELVYPWGVSSLDRHDPNFHPFHHSWENYHKDEGYHNGTIWLWLNGIAMQRMIEAGQKDVAYQLFKNMNHQAMTMGVVGGLGENMDCYPRKDENWPKLTGTYLQAWSNAEHLRVWYQSFLGIQPDMINKKITITPQIPQEIGDLEYKVYVGEGFIEGRFREKEKEYNYTFNNISGKVIVRINEYQDLNVTIEKGDQLVLKDKGNQLSYQLNDKTGNIDIDNNKVAIKHQSDALFKDIRFCSPLSIDHHPVMKKTFSGDRGI
ncbi:amylo-alpha-1,6-glucosidase [Flammeovirga sp. EKP202]|uniref:amylo-alpha-1,6-glucosidase n=1 Tax=Flammeovirga sp. EKP202 TaxID=2770592 RepID=UPI00165FB734|nr:amylo-alpha-1,6-glucosidase [Flammeovirga sp. EKP202]MBD0403698.1 hypothetical protein [Flammeovirga sp. EKP202]